MWSSNAETAWSRGSRCAGEIWGKNKLKWSPHFWYVWYWSLPQIPTSSPPLPDHFHEVHLPALRTRHQSEFAFHPPLLDGPFFPQIYTGVCWVIKEGVSLTFTLPSPLSSTPHVIPLLRHHQSSSTLAFYISCAFYSKDLSCPEFYVHLLWGGSWRPSFRSCCAGLSRIKVHSMHF